jgi:hypothetical protein
MKKLAFFTGAAWLLASSSVFAQEPVAKVEPKAEVAGEKEFGDQGTIAIGGATSLNFGYTAISPPSGSGGNTIDFAVQPDVQYFIINGFSAGGVIAFEWNQATAGGGGGSTTTLTAFGIGPTVGYNVWLMPGTLSLWPQLDFLFSTASISVPSNSIGGGTTTPTSSSSSATIMTVGAFVPLLIHPVKHFHFGVGPFLNLDVSSKTSAGNNAPSVDGNKSTTVGVKLEVAGWL